MKKLMLFTAFLAIFTVSVQAQYTAVKDGKSSASIVVGDKATDKEAAIILQDFIGRISGATLPIVEPAKAKKGDILIGDFQLKNYKFDTSKLKNDGFTIVNGDGYLRIIGGADKGTIYGVVTLLENYLGVRYYTANDARFPKTATIELPAINMVENPVMTSRRNGSYAFKDTVYAHFMRDNDPQLYAGGYWVHTFNRILPADVYGKSHPEFYSLVDGERKLGSSTQWCLSNPELFEVVAAKVDSIFKANPGQNMISLSDNDSDNTNCHCSKCAEIDNMYGGVPSGSRMWFLNKMCERFPDKKFSTLAYIFTRTPPKNIKLNPNISIMLCNIECSHELPYDENSAGFMKDMEGWAEICSDFHNWDYPMDEGNSVIPEPRIHVYQRNAQIFAENKCDKMFMCVGQNAGTQFSELRTLLISKFMWDPYQDGDSLINNFMTDFYGAAAPYLMEYIKMQEGAVIASGVSLLFQGESPVRHKNGYLKPALMKRYYELFDKAAEAVKNDPVKSKYVKRDRMGLQYAELEIMRTQTGLTYDMVAPKLAAFKSALDEFDVKSVNRVGSPAEYADLYTKRYLPRQGVNLAKGANIEFVTPIVNARFSKDADKTITDGLYGGDSFNYGWIGWEGTDVTMIVDMGEAKDFSSVMTDFYHQHQDWTFMPKSVTYSISDDGKNYTQIGKDSKEETKDYRTGKVSFVEYKVESPTKLKARYVKVDIEGVKVGPNWHAGIGMPIWVMMDEIEIK